MKTEKTPAELVEDTLKDLSAAAKEAVIKRLGALPREEVRLLLFIHVVGGINSINIDVERLAGRELEARLELKKAVP